MAEIRIAGIMRAGAYSPNHICNDAAIFNIVAEQLRKRGCEVNIYSEEQFIANGVKDCDLILNMCREPRSVEMLQKLEDNGRLVVNSGYGIENCIRERMARILTGCGITYPESIIVDTNEFVRDRLKGAGISKCWIKRGDYHSRHKEDVTFVRHAEEAQEVLQEYFLRGFRRAVINRHLEGDLIKFYGVAGTPFFYWFYPLIDSYSRFGNEAHNTPAVGTHFDMSKFTKMCGEAAEALGVVVYGGDAIVTSDGEVSIVDFDDWPSFAPCREEAAPYIAKYVLAEVKAHLGKNRL